MKAIHNFPRFFCNLVKLFPIFQSYKNESNSQLPALTNIYQLCCFRYFKVTKMKAIHNPITNIQRFKLLFPIFQSYKNESNSQLVGHMRRPGECCFRYFKVTKMKAIHNFPESFPNCSGVVSDISKLQK